MSVKGYWVRLASGIAVLAALVGLWFGDEYYTEREEKEKEASGKAFVFEPDQLLRIRIQSGASTIEMERSARDANWMMLQPTPGIEADQDAVRNFITNLSEIRKERDLEGVDAGKLADFGLESPRRVLLLGLEGGKELKLEVGGDVQIGKQQGSAFRALSVYGKSSSSDGLIMMPSSVLTVTEKSFGDFRTKSVTKFSRENVASFTYQTNLGELKAAKAEGGKWTVAIAGGKTYSGDSNAIGLYLDKLQRLKAESVIEKGDVSAELLASLGLEPPARTVILSDAQGQELQRLALGVNETQTNAIMADGGIARMSLESFADLTPEIKTLRDLRVMTGVDFTQLKRLQTFKGKTFEKEGQKWYPVAAEGGSKTESRENQESRSEASTLTSDFEFMRAKDVIDAEDLQGTQVYGFDKPLSRFVFEFEEGANPQKVEVTLGNRVEGDETSIYLKHSLSDAVFKVETSWMNALEALDSDSSAEEMKGETEGGLSPQAKKDDQDSK